MTLSVGHVTLSCPRLVFDFVSFFFSDKAVEDAFVPVIKFKFDGIEVSYCEIQVVCVVYIIGSQLLGSDLLQAGMLVNGPPDIT